MNVKIKNKGSGWVSGKCGDYDFEAKVFDNELKFGIDNGRVSKMSIFDKNNNCVMNYDRGWDTEPEEEVVDIYANIMEDVRKYIKINK